jgi:hypothetical protein
MPQDQSGRRRGAPADHMLSLPQMLVVNRLDDDAVIDQHEDVATASPIEIWIDETERRTWFLSEIVAKRYARLLSELDPVEQRTTLKGVRGRRPHSVPPLLTPFPVSLR